jgi:predicted porin
MKKHFIAAAVAATVAAPAVAQVTVYGRIDASYGIVDTAGASSKVGTQASGDFRGSSALGFRGSEDLGGGLKASFALEGDLNVANGDGDGGGGGLAFDRQSWIGLSGAFGGVKVGRTGDPIDSIKGRHAMGYNLFDSSSDAPIVAGGKLPQMVRYDSPSIMGLTVHAANVIDNNGVGLEAGDTDNTGDTTSFGLNYKYGDLLVSYANAVESTVGNNDETTVLAIGYKLPFAQVEFRHQRDSVSGSDKKYNALGVAVPLQAGVRVVGHYQKGSNLGVNANFTSMGFAAEKALSKRTAVYVGYKSKDLTGTGNDVDTTVVGVDHSF